MLRLVYLIKLLGRNFLLIDLQDHLHFLKSIEGDRYFGSSISASQFTGSSCFFTSISGSDISASSVSFSNLHSENLCSISGSIQTMKCSSLSGSFAFFSDITSSTIETIGNYSSFETTNKVDTNILTVGTLTFDIEKAVLSRTIVVPKFDTKSSPNIPDRLNISSKNWYISDGIGYGWCSVSHDCGISIKNELGISNISGEISCSRDGRYIVLPQHDLLVLNIYISDDFGRNYRLVKLIPSASIGIASHISSSGKYMSMLIEKASSMSMYFSQNYGETWNIATGIIDIPYASYMNHIVCSYDGKYWLTYSCCEIYISNDYGTNYSIKSQTPFSDTGSCSMSWDGKYMYCLDKNGCVYGSSDFGNTWSLLKSTKIYLL